MEAATKKDQEKKDKEDKDEERDEEQQDERSEDGAGVVGRIEEITGVVIEASFEEGELPEIFNALEVDIEDPSLSNGSDDDDDDDGGGLAGTEAQPGETAEGGKRKLICEVQQHLGDDRVRAVAMDATD